MDTTMWNRRILVLLLVSTFAFSTAMAVKKVTVASIVGGAATFKIDLSKDPNDIVGQIINQWRDKLNNVLVYKPDLIVFTEECDLPTFRWTREEREYYFRVRGAQVQEFFANVARENQCYISFGIYIETKDGNWNDSNILFDRKGQIAGIYDKNYPTDEEIRDGVQANDKVPVFECDFGRVASVICFDLNFDELRRRYADLKPDIILFPSMYHGGDFVQSYWAYSCRSFLVSSQFNYNVPTEIRNPLGEVVATSTNYTDFAVATINLDRQLVHWGGNKTKLKALKEKYGEAVSIADPGELAVVMVTSEHKSISSDQMLKEFGIETFDDMLNRSRNLRKNQLDK